MPEITEERLKELEAAAEKARNAEASKARLEEENTKIKARAKEAEDKADAAEKKKLEEEGKTNELLLKEREANAKLQKTLEDRTKSVLSEKVKAAVAKHAKDAHDVDMVLRVSEHKGLLKINDEELTVEGVEEFVGKVRETHGFLFGSKRMPDYSNTKGGAVDENPEGKSNDQLYREELAKVTTRQEQAAVMKKYGKDVDSYIAN